MQQNKSMCVDVCDRCSCAGTQAPIVCHTVQCTIRQNLNLSLGDLHSVKPSLSQQVLSRGYLFKGGRSAV